MLWAFAVIRSATWAQLVAVTAANWGRFERPAVVAGLVGLAAVESTVVIRLAWSRGTVAGTLLPAIDMATNAALLAAMNPLMQPAMNPYTVNVFYPYTVSSMVLVGFALRRLVGVIAVPALIVGVYAASTLAWFRYDLLLPENALSYWTFAVVGWMVGRYVRRLARAVDQARATALAGAAELAEERERIRALQERERTLRDLHDGVLQTLEALRRSGQIIDPVVRGRIAYDAVWLRHLVSSDPREPNNDLVAMLGYLQRESASSGLTVELNAAGLGDARLSAQATAALVGAVREALTNVEKHAGTTRAVVRVWSADSLVEVTVVDHGRGFDLQRVPPGVGLARSIAARVRDVGGDVLVESAPGDGTRVRLRVPRQRGGEGPANTGPSASADAAECRRQGG